MVTHPGTNRARRALTSFIRRTPLTTTPRRRCVSGDTARVFLGLPAGRAPVCRPHRTGGQRDLPPNEHRLPAYARQVTLRLQPARPLQMRPGSALFHSALKEHFLRAESMKRYGDGVRQYVCPSVCPGMDPQQQPRCCRLAAVGPAGRKYRSTAAAAWRTAVRRSATNAGSVISSADVGFFI